MVTIYCIEDCNSLKYVGSTKHTLNIRLSKHKHDKKRNKSMSSSKLNLDNCKIYSLETCNECDRRETEQYWIDKIDCVNSNNLNFDSNDWRLKNKGRIKQNYNQWCNNNKERFKEQSKEFNLFRRKSVVNGCYEFINMLNEY
jgi:hypothetical protein